MFFQIFFWITQTTHKFSLKQGKRFKREQEVWMNPIDEAEQNYKWGLFFGKQKRFVEAKQCLLQAIAFNSTHADAWFTLGAHLERIEQNPRCITLLFTSNSIQS